MYILCNFAKTILPFVSSHVFIHICPLLQMVSILYAMHTRQAYSQRCDQRCHCCKNTNLVLSAHVYFHNLGSFLHVIGHRHKPHACILASFTNCKQTDYIVWLHLVAGRDAVVLDPAEHWASGENHQGDNRLAHAALASTHWLGNTHTQSLQLRFNLATPCSSLMRSYSAEGEQL